MPNHWHLVVRPKSDKALGRWMGWVGVTHVRRYHEHYHSRGGGHLYQGRFKSFPVEEDDYFLTLCRYVEASLACGTGRAGRGVAMERTVATGARRSQRRSTGAEPLAGGAAEELDGACQRKLAERQLETLRECVDRGRPFGGEQWVAATARRLGLEFTLRGPGRPRKEENQ